jgi:ATP synthase F1 gamma subunit
MPSLTQLKKEIQFNGQLGSLLNVMKSIAAQQFQALEERWTSNQPFFEVLGAIASSFNLEDIQHPFTQGGGPIGVIAVTSDAGLLGGLNQQVVVAALREYRKQPGAFIIIGKRGLAYVQEQGIPCQEFPGVQDEARWTLADQVRTYALNLALQGRIGRLAIAYPRALSFTLQRVEVVHALPCQAWLKPGTPRGVAGGAILMESSVSSVLEYLVWAWLGEQLFEMFGSSRLAELAARSVHLEGSTQELKRRRSRLMLTYFKQRREVIDRGMRELFAARTTSRG